MTSTRTFGPIQLATWLGLSPKELQRAWALGLIPAPDVNAERWSEQLAKTLPDRLDHIRATLGDHPGHGSVQAAKILAQRTNLDVTRDDVLTLHQQGTLTPVGEFRGWPMFADADLHALDPQTVAAAVQARLDWLHTSLTAPEAAKALGWPQGRFEVTAERRGIHPGKFDRYALTDVQALQTRPDDTDPT